MTDSRTDDGRGKADGRRPNRPRGTVLGRGRRVQSERTAALYLGLWALVLLPAASNCPAAWWEKGFDRWYYKDDWKAEFLSGQRTYGTTITVPGQFTAAWVEVWAERYTLRVNGEIVGHDVDAGTIEAYDLTDILHVGRNQIEVSGGRQVIVEGGVVLKNGQIIPIRTDATWGRRVKTSRERRTGPRGYAGNCHQALMLHYTPEQRAKASLSRLFSLVGRLLDRDRYRFWRVRHVREVLALRGREYDIWRDVLDDTAEALSVAEKAKAAARRGQWASVGDILNAPPRPVAPHIIDTASDLEAAIAIRKARNDCRALRIQIEMLRRLGRLVEPTWSVRLRRIEGDIERALGPRVEDRLLPYLSTQLAGELAELRSEMERRLEVRLDRLNRSTQNRLGWVISNEPLDNDPRRWEFSFAPPRAEVLDLAGLWRFRLDPRDEGTSLGFGRADFDDSRWDKIVAPNKWGWERLGYDRDNPLHYGKNNKPYNGYAWYRKKVVLAAAWKGRDLELDLGRRGENNRDWLFFNGQPVGDERMRREGDSKGRFLIPAALVRPGSTNTIAIRVYNSQNCGGLLGPRLRIYPVGSRPETLRTVCQAGIVLATEYGDDVRQVAYCGALSPAVLVAQSEKRFRIWGWEAKGYPAPAFLAYPTRRYVEVVDLRKGFSIGGNALNKGWLLLMADPRLERTTSCPLALLVVLQRRPERINWEDDGFGGSALALDFATSPGIVALVRPFKHGVPLSVGADGRAYFHGLADGLCNRWVRLMRAYPVAYAELYVEERDKAWVWIGYDYFETNDDWGTEHVRHAALPMLFSYAAENGWPGARSDISARLTPGAAFTADPSATYCGAYMARVGDWMVGYTYDRLEPAVRWKGVGTFTEIRNMTDRDFQRLRRWGANCLRPQIAFDRNWFVKGFFECDGKGRKSGLEGRLLWDDAAVRWLDNVVERHRRNGLTCILNWFWNADYPIKEINGAPPNSVRYWNRRPRARQLIIDFWAKVAQRYADLPRFAIAYDLLNEPATLYWHEYNRFIKDCTAAIRAYDTTHTIFIESANGWAQPEDFDRLEATGDKNTVYEFHFYGPHTFDSYSRDLWFPRYDHGSESYHSWEALEERLLPPIRFSIRNRGAQLCHGEFGITFLGPDEAPGRWLETLLALHEKYRIHWIWWNYDGRAIHRTGLVAGDRINPLVPTLSKFMKK